MSWVTSNFKTDIRPVLSDLFNFPIGASVQMFEDNVGTTGSAELPGRALCLSSLCAASLLLPGKILINY